MPNNEQKSKGKWYLRFSCNVDILDQDHWSSEVIELSSQNEDDAYKEAKKVWKKDALKYAKRQASLSLGEIKKITSPYLIYEIPII